MIGTRGRRADRSSFAEAFLEHHPGAVITCDAGGRNVVFNDAAVQLLGAPPSAAGPDPWTDGETVYDASAERRLQPHELPLARALRREITRDADLYVRRRDGGRGAFRVNAAPVLDDRGGLLGAIAFLRDISGEVTPQEELRLQDSLLAHLPVAVGLVGARDGEIVYANDSWAKLFGYRPDELVGRHVSAINAPTDRTPRARADEIMGGLERDGGWTGEVENVRKDGSHLWTTAEVSSFEHALHGPVWLVVQHDASARHATRRAERDDRSRLRTVFEDAPLAMAVVGNDLRLAESNPALCELTGYSREELAGMLLSDLTHPDDHPHDVLPAARLRLGEIGHYRLDKRYVTRDGAVIDVVEHVAASRGAGGEHLHDIVVVDVRRG